MSTWFDGFLLGHEPRPWSATAKLPAAISPERVFVQPADHGLEVALATAAKRPTKADVSKAWKARQAGRAAPVLLAVGYPGSEGIRVAVCGPSGEDPPVHHDLDPARVERLAAAALAEPNRHAAQRLLLRMLPDVESPLPGVVNQGLLATQELRVGVPGRPDWPRATQRARAALGRLGRGLVEALGFTVQPLSVNAAVLTAGGERRAVAVFLDESETFEAPSRRFEGVSPVSHALALAKREHLSWVVLTRGSEIRLHAVDPDVGVGLRGPSQTFVALNLALLPDDLAGYLGLLFSADALAEGGALGEILERSADFAADLAARLRERVYREAVPALARAVAARLPAAPSEADLQAAYDQALNILFRLLFVAYGEDKELLPYRTNGRYADHSLKRIARLLADELNASGEPVFDTQACGLWTDVTQVWDAIRDGNSGWGVPAYDGGLFSADPQVNPAGAALAGMRLTDAELGPALVALLVDRGDDATFGPVDFRGLSVREFGTIYEGLLESRLSVAPADLTLDRKGTYVPARSGQPVEVSAGSVYLHDRSGARKATGSYFTKPFAVEHLLDAALEPVLSEHLERLERLVDAGDDAAAARAFFDVRCADLAMGSGHFLVAAIDRIEARLSGFLALCPVPAVIAELDRLRDQALGALGTLGDGVEIETAALLRRQVARRCIYGVDVNPIAVELARLAVWIHTFVPGLPLSFLDHNLVVGDSLTGIGTIDEAIEACTGGDAAEPTLFRDQVLGFLARASASLARLATITDATVADVEAARAAHRDALDAVAPARALFDLVVAHRLGEAALPMALDEEQVVRAAQSSGAHDLAREVGALHFPVAFPEVFLRDRPGFDCILGNPPWEKAKLEMHQWWGLRFPGIRKLAVGRMNAEITKLRRERPDLVAEWEAASAEAKRQRALLVAGPYPGMGTGDPDLYKAFCWRFWQTAREGGAIGVVLPRSALAAKGSEPWRRAVLAEGAFADVTMLVNNQHWVFKDVDPRYSVALVSLRKGERHAGTVSLRGPYPSHDRFVAGVASPPERFVAEELLTWTEVASFPLLPSPEAATVFRRLRAAPRLDAAGRAWRLRPVTEFHATNDKHLFVLDHADAPAHAWPVYKGESFNLWEPDTGTYYAWADPEVVTEELQRRRLRSSRRSGSAWAEVAPEVVEDPATLPCRRPRIAFRDVTNRTNTRTVIACLIPPEVVCTHKAPYLVRIRGDERDEAFVLGVLGSMPLDWYARRLVETNVTFFLLNAFPVPEVERSAPERRRVEEIAGRLAAVDERYRRWADAVGVPVGSVSAAEHPDLLAALDAAVARCYGLDEEALGVIFDTFHEGADYSEHAERVVAHFRSLT